MRRFARSPFFVYGLAPLFVLGLAFPYALDAASVPPPVGTGGSVSSGDATATRIGLDLLAAGGNAVDAAVGTALALAVIFPEAGNLGGGGFAVVRIGDELTTLDFREIAPAGATRDMYVDEEGKLIPEASTVGPLASGVPGSPAGLHALHERYGKLPWAVVVEPARRLAADGFVVGQQLHDRLEGSREVLQRFPETAELWFPDGEPLAVGTRLRLTDLAATLGGYAKHGPAAIQTGPVAEAIEAASKRHGGVLTTADLATNQPVWRDPVRFEAFGWQMASMNLPSSGGIILSQATAMLELLEWPSLPRFGADRAHLLAEVLRRSFADRFLLGDPTTSEAKNPATLTGPEWIAHLAASIDRDKATPSSEIHPRPAEAMASDNESADTTHLAVVDGDGGVVSLTTTVNDLFGCGLYVPGAGFFLNNEMDDFAAQPGKPNLYGLVQGEANAVRPGKKMLSSMSPTVIWRGEAGAQEIIALGGRGGSRIPTNTLQVLLNVIVDGDDLQEALDRPRIHHQWLPDHLQVEDDALSPETRAVLEARGHVIEPAPWMGKVHIVRRFADGRVEAASDPRSAGQPGVLRPTPGFDESGVGYEAPAPADR